MPATTPEDVDTLFAEHMNAGDLEALVGLYEPDAAFMRVDRTVAQGLPAIRTELAAFLALRPRIQMKVVQVMQIDDVAVLYDDWSLTATDANGAAVSMSGKAIEVVRRQGNGTWLYLADDPNARG
jgi:uncharacterized protein (TIGR02246 family)